MYVLRLSPVVGPRESVVIDTTALPTLCSSPAMPYRAQLPTASLKLYKIGTMQLNTTIVILCPFPRMPYRALSQNGMPKNMQKLYVNVI